MASLRITGTPTTPGDSLATITVTDADGNSSTIRVRINVVGVQNPIPPVMEVLSHQTVGTWNLFTRLLPDYVDFNPLQHRVSTAMLMDISPAFREHHSFSSYEVTHRIALKHFVVEGYSTSFGLTAISHEVESDYQTQQRIVIPASTLQGSDGMNRIVSSYADDANASLGDIGFDFPFYGGTYRNNIFICSNGYLTFGYSSTAYTGLSHTSPGRGLFVSAWDRSYNAVYTKAAAGSFTVRYEGSPNSGFSAPASMIWEATLHSDGSISLVTGQMASTNRLNTITDGGGTNFTDYVVAENTYIKFTPQSITTYTVDSQPTGS